MDADSTYHDFLQALAFINTAIGVQPDAAPFRGVARHADGHRAAEFGVTIYQDHPGRVVDHFTIRLQGSKFVLTERGAAHDEPDWLVSADHIRDIARNPLRYLQDPSQFDLGWLDGGMGEQENYPRIQDAEGVAERDLNGTERIHDG